MLIRARPGESFNPSAREHNELIQGTRAALEQEGGVRPAIATVDPDLPMILNNTGATRESLQAVPLGDAVATPTEQPEQFRSIIAFEAPANNDPKYFCRFGILRQKCEEDQLVQAVVHGITPARVKITNWSHNYASLYPGEYLLRSCPVGFAEILYRESDTGDDVQCYVRIGQCLDVQFELQTDLTKWGQACAYIIDEHTGERAPDWHIHVVDNLGYYEGYGSQETGMSGSSEGNGDKGWAQFRATDGKWVAKEMSCDPPGERPS